MLLNRKLTNRAEFSPEYLASDVKTGGIGGGCGDAAAQWVILGIRTG